MTLVHLSCQSCAIYEECDLFDSFIANGKPVFAVEYTTEYDEDTFTDEVCPLVDQTGMGFILKKLNLGSDFIVSCL